MRVAVVADVHGDADALDRAIIAASEVGFDLLASVGDLVDFLNPQEGAERRLEVAVNWDPRLAELTEGALLVGGNQEERARAFLGDQALSAAAKRVLSAPLVQRMAGVTFAHGHIYEGDRVSSDRWVPLGAKFDTNILIHGHHHRNSVIRLGERRDWASADDLDIRSGFPVRFERDRSYLVNVGATRGQFPSWGLMDTERWSWTPFFTTLRYRKNEA